METIELLRQASERMQVIVRAAAKANEGILELVAVLANTQGQNTVAPVVGLEVLTNRQREIFGLIANQVSVGDIAARLKLSPRTVEAHRDTIRRRLKFKTVAELNEYAIKHGKG